MQDLENLACHVEKYPCLYDKGSSAYKEMLPKKNAWARIDEAMDKENGWAQREWGLLLNRYSKRRSAYKKVNVSCAKASDDESAKKKFDEYLFLSWLDVFIRPKNTKSNVINSLGTSIAIDEAIEHESSMDAYPPPSESGTDKDSSTEFSVQKKRRVNRDGVFEEISSYLKDRKERKEQSKDPDDVFGMMVAAELKSFPEERKYKIKHEINQVLYNNHVAIGPSSSNLTYIQPQVVSKEKHFPQVIFND